MSSFFMGAGYGTQVLMCAQQGAYQLSHPFSLLGASVTVDTGGMSYGFVLLCFFA